MRNDIFIAKIKSGDSGEYLVCDDYKIRAEGIDLRVLNFDSEITDLNFAVGEMHTDSYNHERGQQRFYRFDEFLTPVEKPRNLIGVAWNYKEHATETGYFGNPKFFRIGLEAIANPFGEFPLGNRRLFDYEAELGILINRRADKNSKFDEVENYIGGFLLANDLTSRELQILEGSLFDRVSGFYPAKSFSGSKPLGPFLVRDVSEGTTIGLSVERDKKVEKRQEACLSSMIYSPNEIVSYLIDMIEKGKVGDLLKDKTLYPGDIILAGTPRGTAFNSTAWDVIRAGGKRRFIRKEERENKKYLREGDVVHVFSRKLGTQRIKIV